MQFSLLTVLTNVKEKKQRRSQECNQDLASLDNILRALPRPLTPYFQPSLSCELICLTKSIDPTPPILGVPLLLCSFHSFLHHVPC